MNISLKQETLLQVIQDIQKAIPSRPSLPILSCILIETNEKGAFFLATDLNLGIRSHTPCVVKEAGKVAVPAKVFTEFVSSLGSGDVEITVKDQELTIKSAHSNAKIQCLAADDFPAFPEKEGEEVVLPTALFSPAVQLTAFASSSDETRPVLTSVLFSFGEEMEIAATDGFRLATLSLPHSSKQGQLLVPAKALQEVLKIVTRKKTENVSFTVSEKLKQVFFTFEEVDILVRLMEGAFPPYQKIIPPDFQTQITFDGQEFGQLLKTAMIFARESSGIIRLKIEGEELKIVSSSSSLGSQESTLQAQVIQGGNQEIAFNAKYMVDFLSVLKPEKIWMGMNESLKPALFRPEGMENYRYIVMPFKVNQ
jgi:DNA polymerase-3 subunit beta